MGEADAIAISTDGPVTRARLCADLAALGVRPGGVWMVHTALSALGWVIGGPATVVAALREVVGPDGTLMMPTFTGANSDPAEWRNPPVPADWCATIRAEMPAFDPATSPSRMMGRVVEYFRTVPGAVRSGHPSVSWAALGPQAEALTTGHALDDPCGPGSPMARAVALGAQVLSLGTRRTSVLHLAEHLADWPGKRVVTNGAAVRVDGERRWVTYRDLDLEDDDFEACRQAFVAQADAGDASEGTVGYGPARRLACGPLVAFASDWLSTHRRAAR